MASEVFRGIGIYQSVGIGRVHLVDRRNLSVPHFRVSYERIDHEIQRFKQALELSKKQLKDITQRASDNGLTQASSILEVHGLILQDQLLVDATVNRIRQGQNAEWAFEQTSSDVKQQFKSLEEDYFRNRRSDVDVVTKRVQQNLMGADTEILDRLSDDAVIVAHDLSPADAIALARYKARAFVTERGGWSSHTAILARALEIPSVLGVAGIVQKAASGDDIVVDGRSGEVVLSPETQQLKHFSELSRAYQKEKEVLLAEGNLPSQTLDGTSVELGGNIEFAEECAGLKKAGAQGIGLYRTEFLPIEFGTVDADVHYSAYRSVLEAMQGPVTIRTADSGGDKLMRGRSEEYAAPETNPALGLRGIRRSLENPDEFEAQLEGLLRASVHGDLRILLPMITDSDQIAATRSLIAKVQKRLKDQDVAFKESIPLGAMIETPSAALVADTLAQHADFFTIGTNDLVQYALASDRKNDSVAHLYRPDHPAVVRMIKIVAEQAARFTRPVSLCGELSGDTLYIPLILGLGIRRVSVSAPAIPLVRRAVRSCRISDCEDLAGRALDAQSPDEVRELLFGFKNGHCD